ncbi:MAG: hypothetical protein J4G14_14915 [Dehalococcoidia bacterium]|nr:hypothetical protein [Dehalococcoidia bacterium]
MPDKHTLTSSLRHLGALATTTLLTATLLACSSTTEEPPSSQQVSATEAKTQSTKKQWSEDKDEWKSLPDGTTLERTARLAEDAGGAGRGDRTVLVLPTDFVDGRTPLIVSLHGYGADSDLPWKLPYVIGLSGC